MSKVLKKRRLPDIVTDPMLSAKEAGLRYVSDAQPGIRRKRSGKGFRYVDAEGKPVRNRDILQRIRSLVIPPAWRDVWICADSRGHLQATGRDARGRKQSRYHPRWRIVRGETKYERMLLFGAALRGLRARLEEDLALPGLPRNKVLATIVRLMERTLIRVGNEEYVRGEQVVRAHNHAREALTGKWVDGSVPFSWKERQAAHGRGTGSTAGADCAAMPGSSVIRTVRVSGWVGRDTQSRFIGRE